MSRILLPQRGILHDRLHEDWVIPLILRGDAAAAKVVVARISSIVNNQRAMAAVAASSTAMAAVTASSTAMAAVAASSTAMAAVVASSMAMAAVVASSTAMAAVFGTSISPNYMAREKVWDSEIATDAVLGDGRAWLVANVQTESSQSVLARAWWNYSGSRKALVLQARVDSSAGFKLRYTRNGEETTLYNPGSGLWADINIATYSSEMYNQSSYGRTLLVRWVQMQA